MIDPKSVSDRELVFLVKEKQDSIALQELTDRHSGIYCAIAQKYSGFSNKIQLEEMKDDKQYNIYQWIIKYDPDRNMKLGTFIGEMTRYLCLDTLSETPEKVEITEYNEPVAIDNSLEQAATDDSVQSVSRRAARVADPRFWTILKLRHFGDKTMTWREIGKEVGVTYEAARGIYNRHIEKVKDFAL